MLFFISRTLNNKNDAISLFLHVLSRQLITNKVSKGTKERSNKQNNKKEEVATKQR
jgi:hypothetical protein